MPLLGSRCSVTSILGNSNAATVSSVVHSLPGIPDRWGYTFQSAGGMLSGAVNVTFNFFSADAQRLYYRPNITQATRRRIRVWAECIHSLVR